MLTIIIPHYRTEQFVSLCLRSLRKYSRGEAQVIVVDNNSADGSVEYLRSVGWIELIENRGGAVGGRAHREALDLALKRARGEWLCFFHSDTIVLRDGWDEALMKRLELSGAAGLSTFVRDINPFETGIRRFKRRLKELRSEAGRMLKRGRAKDGKIMSYCFIINRRAFEATGFSFLEETGDVADGLYHQHIEGKLPFLILGRRDLEPLMWHTSNVTSVLTGQITEKRLVNKFSSKSRALMDSRAVREIMDDGSLDK